MTNLIKMFVLLSNRPQKKLSVKIKILNFSVVSFVLSSNIRFYIIHLLYLIIHKNKCLDQTFLTDPVYSNFISAGINNVDISAAIGSCKCTYMILFMDIILGYCFDSQSLSECCPSSSTVNKSTTGEEKAAGDSQEPFYFGHSINV